MSGNSNDNRSGFKNSRIDLSQLGDDSWSKILSGDRAAPGPRRKPGVAVMPASCRRTKLDDLFETRVHAATGRRAGKQKSGQNRVLLFAGGLFLASVGGVAAAYYLVGPPMAQNSYVTEGAGLPVAQTSSYEADNSSAGTSSHFLQGSPVSTNMSGTTADYTSGASVMTQPSADDQSGTGPATIDPVAVSVSEPPVAAEPATALSKVAEPQQTEVAEPQSNNVVMTEKPANTDAAPETVTDQPETERIVRIVPTAVSEEVETKTNVNASQTPAATGESAGQWVALPPDTKPVAPSAVAATAPQKPDSITDPVKTQQELFEAFRDYLESSGHTVTGDNRGQEELFNKFIRWSAEAQKEN